MSTLAYANCDATLALLVATPAVVAATPVVGQIIATAVATVAPDADATFKAQKKARTESRGKKVPSGSEKVVPAAYQDATSSRNINMVLTMQAAWGVPVKEVDVAVWNAAFPADRLFLTDNFVLSIRQHTELCASAVGIVDLNVRLKEKSTDSNARVALLIEAANLANTKMDLCAHPAVKHLAVANLKIAELLQKISDLEKEAQAVKYEEEAKVAEAGAEVVHKRAASVSSTEDASDGSFNEHHNTIAADDYDVQEAAALALGVSSANNGIPGHGAGKGLMKRPLD